MPETIEPPGSTTGENQLVEPLRRSPVPSVNTGRLTPTRRLETPHARWDTPPDLARTYLGNL